MKLYFVLWSPIDIDALQSKKSKFSFIPSILRGSLWRQSNSENTDIKECWAVYVVKEGKNLNEALCRPYFELRSRIPAEAVCSVKKSINERSVSRSRHTAKSCVQVDTPNHSASGKSLFRPANSVEWSNAYASEGTMDHSQERMAL
ncbi:unnamed protein product [Leptosia nina]|uniref:Uncharacterized protein n=1 Tax=Leptosia nina TaxID=320188 RepID=A0AAV1JEN3_9NEOP